MDDIEPVSSFTNRRAHIRPRALKNSLIVFNEGQCTMKCHILEVSDSGAKLVPADPLLCPKEFVLKPQIGPSDECEVVWRKGTQVGVTYVSEAVSIKESANDRGVALYAPDKVHERA